MFACPRLPQSLRAKLQRGDFPIVFDGANIPEEVGLSPSYVDGGENWSPRTDGLIIQIETIDQGRIWVTVGAPSKKGPEVDLKREPFEHME